MIHTHSFRAPNLLPLYIISEQSKAPSGKLAAVEEAGWKNPRAGWRWEQEEGIEESQNLLSHNMHFRRYFPSVESNVKVYCQEEGMKIKLVVLFQLLKTDKDIRIQRG